MRYSASLLAALALGFTVFVPAVSIADDKALTKEEVEAIVKKVIAENPKMVFDAAVAGQQKSQEDRMVKAQENIVKMKDKLQRDPGSPVAGNPNGDVTVVEFFDYHCHYCKDFVPHISKLLSDDKNIRVVFKEFPILAPDSADAAKAALAVYSINPKKYFEYHTLLMKSAGAFNEDMLAEKAKQVGIDEDTFKAAYSNPAWEKQLAANKVLAKDLAISGTPSIIIGNEFMPGVVSDDVLKANVQKARDEAKHKTPGAKSEE